jgi:hypothetical protein
MKKWKSLLNESFEPIIDVIKRIVSEHQWSNVKFLDGSNTKVDAYTAQILLTVYNALTKEQSKKKFEDMLNKNRSSFMQAVSFAMKATK